MTAYEQVDQPFVGIDFSSFAVDMVLLSGSSAWWFTYSLGKDADAFTRVRRITDRIPGRTHVFWHGVAGVGIEEPTGKWKPGSGFRAQGVILAAIPADIAVKEWVPSSWRKNAGLSGRASKEEVTAWVKERQPEAALWTEDACDAYCMALASRNTAALEHS